MQHAQRLGQQPERRLLRRRPARRMTLLPVRSTSAPSAAEEALLTQQAEHFMAEGYVILRGVLSDEQDTSEVYSQRQAQPAPHLL